VSVILDEDRISRRIIERGMKFVVLVFEGPPFSGKTTLRNHFLNEFDNIVVLDRFTGSRWVLLKLRGCPDEYLDHLFGIEYALDSYCTCVLFLVTASPYILRERASRVVLSEQVDEVLAARDPEYLKRVYDLYEQYFSRSRFSIKFRISTEHRTDWEVYREAKDLLFHNLPGYLVRRDAWKFSEED